MKPRITVACKNCNNLFETYVKKNGKIRQHCSKKCANATISRGCSGTRAIWQKERSERIKSARPLCSCGCGQQVTRIGRHYLFGHYADSIRVPRITRRCQWCGKSMVLPAYDIREHCSRSCASKHLKGGKRKVPYVKSLCPICGTEYERTANEEEKGRKATCSYACGIEATRRTHLKDPNGYPTTRQGQRDMALQLRQCCDDCGWNKIIDILVIHHADHNLRNGDPKNISLFCPNCHAIEHYKLKTGWFTLHKHGSDEKSEHIASIRNIQNHGSDANPRPDLQGYSEK